MVQPDEAIPTLVLCVDEKSHEILHGFIEELTIYSPAHPVSVARIRLRRLQGICPVKKVQAPFKNPLRCLTAKVISTPAFSRGRARSARTVGWNALLCVMCETTLPSSSQFTRGTYFPLTPNAVLMVLNSCSAMSAVPGGRSFASRQQSKRLSISATTRLLSKS